MLRAKNGVPLVVPLSLIVAGFGAYRVLGPGATADFAGQPADAAVRIAAQNLENGGVRVALQERDSRSERGWRHAPRASMLPAGHPIGA